MAWDIEKVTEKVKKNPGPWLIGGGVGLVVLFLAFRRGGSDPGKVTGYADPPQLPVYGGGGGAGPGGEDMGEMAAMLLEGFSLISERQQESLTELIQSQQDNFMSVSQGNALLFGELFKQQESIYNKLLEFNLQKETKRIEEKRPVGAYREVYNHSYDYSPGLMELPGGGSVELPGGTWSGTGISVTQAGGWDAWERMVAEDVAHMIETGKLDSSVMR